MLCSLLSCERLQWCAQLRWCTVTLVVVVCSTNPIYVRRRADAHPDGQEEQSTLLWAGCTLQENIARIANALQCQLYSQICPHLKESNRPVLSGPSCLKDSRVHKTSRVAVILLILTIQLSRLCRNCPKCQKPCQLYLFTVLMGAMPADPGINPTHCTHCTFGLNKAHCGAFRWENTQIQTHKYKNTETQIHITNLD